MHVTKFALILMSGVLCQACASDPQQAKPSSAATTANRPSATATKQRTDSTNMQILWDKVKADKKLLVADTWTSRRTEPAKFWPLYKEYQRELDLINKRMAGTISDYADAYRSGPVEDGNCIKTARGSVGCGRVGGGIEEILCRQGQRGVAGSQGGRYIQIETKIRSLLRLELARAIPLVWREACAATAFSWHGGYGE